MLDQESDLGPCGRCFLMLLLSPKTKTSSGKDNVVFDVRDNESPFGTKWKV